MSVTINWIKVGDYLVGANSPLGLEDVLNRALRQLLIASGEDPDGQVVGYAKIGHTHKISDIIGNAVGPVAFSGQVTINTGVNPPIVTDSVAVCANLNADKLDGLDKEGFALSNHTHVWSDISNTPTTRDGYGITDVFTESESDVRYAPIAHVHDAGDITTGTLDPVRLGSGVPDNTKFLRGDSTWAVPAGGGGSSVLPYPDNPPTVPSAYDDEFTGAVLDAKWAVITPLTAPNAYDVNASIPSWLNVKLPNNVGSTLEIAQTVNIPASQALSFTIKYSAFNYAVTHGLFFYVKDAGYSNGLHIGTYFNSGVNKISLSKKVAGTDTFDISTANWAFAKTFLHLQRDAGDNWQLWFSQDGISWQKLGAAITLSFVTTTLSILIENTAASAPCNIAVDWIRSNWLTL